MEPLFDNIYYWLYNHQCFLYRKQGDTFQFTGCVTWQAMLDHPELAVDMAIHRHDVNNKVAS